MSKEYTESEYVINEISLNDFVWEYSEEIQDFKPVIFEPAIIWEFNSKDTPCSPLIIIPL